MTYKFTLFFTKEYPMSMLSYKDYMRHIVYGLRRAGVKFVFSQGYHPRPKVYSVMSLPLGIVSCIEPISIEVYNESLDGLVLSDKLPRGIDYLGYIDDYIEEYIAVYRHKYVYFLKRHPKEGVGRYIKDKNIPPYEIIKEDIIIEGYGSIRYYLGGDGNACGY